MVEPTQARIHKAFFWFSSFLLLDLSAPLCSAQYFGQNKGRYSKLDFKILQTEHFDIYYYDREKEAAVAAGRMAERWYERLSKVLEYQLSSRQPVILYANPSEFRSTTVIPGFIGEATGGVTEGLRRRIILPLAGPLAETDHVLGHELVHAFQYDIATRAGPRGGAGLPGTLRLPLWFVEGMAEYLSLGSADPLTAMWMRYAVRQEKTPAITDLDNPEYFPYRYGQALWAFIAGRYGDQTVGAILKSAGRAGRAEPAIERVLKTSVKALSKEWHQALEKPTSRF